MSVELLLLSIDRNINYVSESISYMVVKDMDRISITSYEDKNIEYDLVSLRFYLSVMKNFRQYLFENNEEPLWDINIRDIIEKSYNIIVKYLGMKYQWSNNDN